MERYESVRALSDASGIPVSAIYGAIRRGELAAFVPNGNRRGYRVRPSEFERWTREIERGRELGGSSPAREMVPVGAQQGG